MDTYSILREFADSWGLLGLFLMFVGVVIFAFRPGSKEIYKDVADLPLRNTERPSAQKESFGDRS